MGTLTIKATVKASYKVVTPGFLLTSRTKHLQASSGDCRSQCSCWHDPRSNTCAWQEDQEVYDPQNEKTLRPVGLQRLVLRQKI